MARRTRERIRVPAKFDQWIEGLDNLDAGDEVLREWINATERFYGHSQETVHVVSNALRTSGRHHTERDGRHRVNGDLTYGGTEECDYAIYEQGRGAPHDFITQAFARSRDDYERALLDGIDAAIARFL
jgi:hypothetical protein